MSPDLRFLDDPNQLASWLKIAEKIAIVSLVLTVLVALVSAVSGIGRIYLASRLSSVKAELAGPRSVPPSGPVRTQLISWLKPFAGRELYLIRVSGDAEAMRYSEAVQQLFQEAGWIVTTGGMHGGPDHKGTIARCDEGAKRPDFAAVNRVFRRLRFRHESATPRRTNFHAPAIELWLGHHVP